MKHFILAMFLVLGTSFSTFAQEKVATAVQSGAVISVNKEVHDYGQIEQGGDPYCEFEVKNEGTEPLIISNAKGSCGCTVPEWSREPVMPGKTTLIKVRYDTKRLGPINKSVTLTSNASNEATTTLRIKGNVNPKPTEGAPTKATPAGAPTKEG